MTVKEILEKDPNAAEVEGKFDVDTDRYLEFVNKTTSDASTNTGAFINRVQELQAYGADVPRLLTAAVGMSAEAGEFTEIVKKIIFQGKPYSEDNKEHLLIELGDVMWYFSQACMALGVRIEDVIVTNTVKLMKRYPGEMFSVDRSENRSADDR
jgi:NTP pyrophosphatase (non-canonical NTP hydrolase)